MRIYNIRSCDKSIENAQRHPSPAPSNNCEASAKVFCTKVLRVLVDIETVNGDITIGAGTDDESNDPMADVVIKAANAIDLAAGTLGMLIAGDVAIAGDAVDIEANDGNVHIVAAGEESDGDGNVRIEAGTDVTIDAKMGKLFKF